MDNNSVEVAVVTAQNRKKAALSMCKVVLLLMAVNVLSEFLSLSFAMLTEHFTIQIVQFIAKVFAFFGASKTEGYTAARLILGSESFSSVMSMVTTFLSLVVPVTIFARLEGGGSGETFRIDGEFAKPLVPMFCLCHLFTTFASVFSGFVNDFMLPDSAEVYEALTGVVSHKFNLWEFVISVLCVAVFVPLVEDYVFRGVIFSYFSKYGTHFGIVASAVIFGIAHASPVQSVYAFVFGLFSATLVALTGNIKTSVLFHSLNNFLTVALGYVMGEVTDSQFNLISCFYLMIVSAIGIYGMYVFCKDGGIMAKLSEIAGKNDNPCAEKCGMMQILVLPLLAYLAYYAFCVFRTVM